MESTEYNAFSGKHTITILLSVFVLGTYAVTWLSVHHPKAKEYKSGKLVPIIICKAIIDSESIQVEWEGKDIEVRFLGIDGPLRRPETLIAAGLDPRHEEKVVCNALRTWLFKKRVMIHFPEGEQEIDDNGQYVAYVDIYGVDVGRKLLREGRMFAAETPLHPRLAHYQDCEVEAREREIGIWRK